jgi:hypothetical protein
MMSRSLIVRCALIVGALLYLGYPEGLPPRQKEISGYIFPYCETHNYLPAGSTHVELCDKGL